MIPTAAFRFEVFLKVPGRGGRIEHARLILEDEMFPRPKSDVVTSPFMGAAAGGC